MRNKILSLFFLFSNLCFVDTAYSHFVKNDSDCPETCAQSLISDFDCGVCDAYRYVSLGAGPIVFIPNVGVGYRERHSQFGWDKGVSFSSIGYVHQLSAYWVRHYYLSPYQQNSAYLGLGLMGSGIVTNGGEGGATLSPDFVFGREFARKDERRHFIEMHIAAPTVWLGSKSNSWYFPLMYIKYGMSF